MSNEQKPNAQAPSTEEKIDRRTLGSRVGRFIKYTAPAVLVLTTAQQAHAS
jgi:hypothetical protein